MWCYSVHEDDDDGDDDDNDDGDENDEDDDAEKNVGDEDDVVTVHANSCVAPNLLHLKHPETPQELQTPRQPETVQDVPAYTVLQNSHKSL